jgi:hypothetical protein
MCQLVPELFMRLILMLAFAAVAWLTPTQVDACGPTPPSFTLLTDAMGRVPAGTRVLKLYVYGSSIQPRPPRVIVSSGAGGLPVTVPATLRVSAAWLLEVDLGNAAVQAGVSYSLSVEGVESEAGNLGYAAQIPFTGAAASPMPMELGRLALDKRATGKMTVGVCGHSDEGEHVLIRLVASAAAEPWLRAVKHQLLVDGAPAFESEIPLVDHVARPSETVIRAVAHCDRATSAGEIPYERGIELSLSAGEHSVKWASTFPDGSTLETPALAVDLRCANLSDDPDSADAGCDLGHGQGGGAQSLALFILLFSLHARAARRRA